MTDLDIIKEIEKELHVTLQKLDKIERPKQGYILNSDGRVSGLELYWCRIENLKGVAYVITTQSYAVFVVQKCEMKHAETAHTIPQLNNITLVAVNV